MRKPDPGFSIAALAALLFGEWRLPGGSHLRVAYSGGLDSHVLLYALAALRTDYDFSLGAFHIDHGLHAASTAWSEHCARVCHGLAVPFEARRVDVTAVAEEGVEAAARRARYAALAGMLAPGECLLTAHQRDDQAETVLLQLLRGAGVAGLAAMPARASFGTGEILRPLLGFGRVALHAYALEHNLVWIEDPSNHDTRLRRNFLRHEILPRIARHWPDSAGMLTRAATHAAEAVEILDEVARADVAACRHPECDDPPALSATAVAALSAARQRNLLRHWLRRQGFLAPGAHHLDEVLAQIRTRPRTQQACVRWPGAELWRYRDQIVVLPPGPAPDLDLDVAWDLHAPLTIAGVGQLRTESVCGRGLARARVDGVLRIRLRRGGEHLMLPGRAHHHALKKLVQAAGMPPWLRPRLPLFYSGGELVAVADRWVCAPYAARPDEEGLVIVWKPFADRGHSAREPEKIR